MSIALLTRIRKIVDRTNNIMLMVPERCRSHPSGHGKKRRRRVSFDPPRAAAKTRRAFGFIGKHDLAMYCQSLFRSLMVRDEASSVHTVRSSTSVTSTVVTCVRAFAMQRTMPPSGQHEKRCTKHAYRFDLFCPHSSVGSESALLAAMLSIILYKKEYMRQSVLEHACPCMRFSRVRQPLCRHRTLPRSRGSRGPLNDLVP